MSELQVRDVPDTIVSALERRATRNGRSVEAEHRRILEEALGRGPERGLAEIMLDGPFREPDFRLERDESPARDVEL